jgi:hypothetical protein
MTGLLVDLYRYREREKKENQEDWLTECLAAVLRALPDDLLAIVLHRLTRQPLEAILRVSGHIGVETQKTIERGADGRSQRPDLVISIGKSPWLLFENKVFHSVAREEGEGGDVETQLHRYGKWLQGQEFRVAGLVPSLVFVTYGSATPADFVDRQSLHAAYSGLGRYCSTWGQLGRLLGAATADLDETLHARALVSGYNHYLENHGMADDYPEYSDLAGLGMFVEKAGLFKKLVDDMFARVGAFAPFNGRTVWAHPMSETGCYVAYRYLAARDIYDKETFILIGIWFPERGDGWCRRAIEEEAGIAISPAPKIIIQLGNDEEHALKRIEGLPGEGWYRPLSEFVTFRDFASFPGDATERANAIFAWLDVELAKLKRHLG